MRNRIVHICLAIFLAYAPMMAEGRFPSMVEIPSGYFWMGSAGWGFDFDESPVHKVYISEPFRMSVTEITNAQYEEFAPDHKALRGVLGFSNDDDEAVVNVSYNDAEAYCRWLSQKTGKTYRLPTEAEWEYACRAGTYTLFNLGNGLPKSMKKNQSDEMVISPVSLKTGVSRPNAFGLYDMHGNVEEWCKDWYGEYPDRELENPAGPSEGIFKVTRGGSHSTSTEFLRSSQRAAALPGDRHFLLGFRVVETDMLPVEYPVRQTRGPKVSQKKHAWKQKTGKPFWSEPVPFVNRPVDGSPYYRHNHQPAITWCDNGDLLAIWFSCESERGREMVVLSSRLRKGERNWDAPTLFFKVPDRNMTGCSLMHLPDGRLMHLNGVAASSSWKYLAMVVRFSSDNGYTWTTPQIVAPDHIDRHQVIAGPILTSDGSIIQCCDAGPGGHDGTAVHISRDMGMTWTDPWDGAPLPEFAEGATGTTIAGIHAGIVELKDGSLMALGRGNGIRNAEGLLRMPMSISEDGGKTWRYHASEFPPIDGSQRLVLLKLNEGPLLLMTFTHSNKTPEKERGMDFDGTRKYGLFAALSYDDGKTWPVKRLFTDGEERMLDGGAWTRQFVMDENHAEPFGYMAAVQTPDNTVHLVSSRIYYSFNLAWLLYEK